MKILLEGRRSIGGIERYTQNLIRLLTTALSEEELIVYGQRKGKHPSEYVLQGLIRSALGDFRRVFTDQYLIPRCTGKEKASLFHSVNYFVPLLLSSPCVVTCFDLWLLDHVNEKKQGWMKYYERWQLQDGLQRAAHIITLSETIARQIKERFKVNDRRITVIYPPLTAFFETGIPDKIRPLLEGKYFLTVGTLEPRKNLPMLIEGHHLAYKECGIPLYLAGAYGWNQKEVLHRIDESQGAVRWLGAVHDSTLASLYKNAVALIAFSRDEGFDYPAVEALSFGTPMVASDIPVHREMLCNLGRYAPPDNPAALSQRILEAANLSDAARDQFKEMACQHVCEIRNHGSVNKYLDIYRRVIADSVKQE